MRDVFEAIEQLSALLAMRVERAANKRGWACRSAARLLGVGQGRQIHLIGLTVNLPQGVAATFTPRPEGTADSWPITVQRSDGVMRRSWSEGLRVARSGERFVLQLQGELLTDLAINALLDDLSRPAPTGVALWVRKVWAIRFGRLPLPVSELLDRVQDADVLDEMHGAVLRAADAAEAAALLLQLGGKAP